MDKRFLAFGEGDIKEWVKNVLNFKKTSRVIIVAAIALLTVLSVWFTVNKVGNTINTANWETYIFPFDNFDKVSFECNETPYNPEYVSVSAQLMNNRNVQGLTYSESFMLVKQDGHIWKIVPFADRVEFVEPAFSLEYGMSTRYSLRPKMLTVKLNEGRYRIVTDIYHHEVGGQEPAKHTVWAEFTIDRNAPLDLLAEPERLDNYINGEYVLFYVNETISTHKRGGEAKLPIPHCNGQSERIYCSI